MPSAVSAIRARFAMQSADLASSKFSAGTRFAVGPRSGALRYICVIARRNPLAASAVHATQRALSMIVLSRRKNESIVINDDITIVVIEIRGDKVRLGVEAPKECPVHRHEVYEAIRRNQESRSLADLPWREAPPVATRSAAATAPAPVVEPRAVAVAAPPVRDGLCCPACGSDAVDVARIKIAYQGKELVRRRKCDACNNEFHTIERVEQL
jgi:carbon storage regulator